MTLLADEEREYLKLSIKMSARAVEKISLGTEYGTVLAFYDKDGVVDYSQYLKENSFKNMIPNKEYTLKELGLDN